MDATWEECVAAYTKQSSCNQYRQAVINKDEEYTRLKEILEKQDNLLAMAYEELKAREGYVLMPKEWVDGMEEPWCKWLAFTDSWKTLVDEFSYKETK